MNVSYLLGLFALAVILLKAWQGWRLGLVRQVVGLGALAVATGAGYYGSAAAGGVLSTMLPFPAQALAAIGGLLAGLVVYLTITILSAVLFKKTSDQGVTLVRVGYGLAGAAIGAVYGMVLVGALALGLRLLGSVAETKLGIEKNARFSGGKPAKRDPLAARLAAAKEAVEAGPGGALLRAVDPLPETTYATLNKLATLASDSRSIERFIQYPGVRPVMAHPKVLALINDPEVNKAITEHRYLSLLSNPRLIAAANDAEVAARVRAIDFEQALDHALHKPDSAK
ncbi:MAG: CvpA family protein [Chthoniobacteraceae bacterium]